LWKWEIRLYGFALYRGKAGDRVVRKGKDDYTTISVRKVNRDLAQSLLDQNRELFEKLPRPIRSLSDLYEKGILTMRVLLELKLIEEPDEEPLGFKIKGLHLKEDVKGESRLSP